MHTKIQILVGSAVAGILGAALSIPLTASAADAAATAQGSTSTAKKIAPTQKGKCFGATDRAGQGECSQPGNSCAGENTCKGKGWLTKTKADCDALAKKRKGVHFDVAT